MAAQTIGNYIFLDTLLTLSRHMRKSIHNKLTTDGRNPPPKEKERK